MEYNHQEIEKKWQAYWAEKKTFQAKDNSSQPKYYVLDMFPYPSGAGLHVGHPLGYIASDIVSRYKRLEGYNVLHPMGYDSFGLPAEQYAIQTGQHPALTTEKNIARYREQLDRIGFSFDWDREVRTSDPSYYKWTQWIFLQLFHSWYNPLTRCAEHINTLIRRFEERGYAGVNDDILTGGIEKSISPFTAEEWKAFSEAAQQNVLMNFRMAYLDEAWVNWCPALGTVLANDEVKDGVSERGGHPVERKLMKQWSLRITAYAERLLTGLDTVEWSDSIKDAQRNWIGKSEGASVFFPLKDHEGKIEVFTTRPDTLFGVSFLTLAPEHELVDLITSPEQREKVQAYVAYAKNRSERERMADVKKITGEFTGAYALHPFTQEPIPIWIGDYVLAGYGTGAVMAVPAGDQRDYDFANHFNLPIPPVFEGVDISEKADPTKEAKIINSDFLNGLTGYEGIKACIRKLEESGKGKGKINYRLRDAVFGRQRYWGEPIPIYYKNGIPYPVPEEELPVTLPEVDKYLPTEDGEPPLARAKDWKYKGEFDFEHTTMPGWAGSSWYFFRYMDPKNAQEFASREALNYWGQVDLYIGGAEHATGHLLYFRFWTKFLKDLGYVNIDEPAKKLINQGMIQGVSEKIKLYGIRYSEETLQGKTKANTIEFLDKDGKVKILTLSENKTIFYSSDFPFNDDIIELHVDISFVKNNVLNIDRFRNEMYNAEYSNAVFVCLGGYWENGEFFSFEQGISSDNQFRTISQVEKMSKRWYNVVNPDEICGEFGADTLRMYEMFLGPLEQHKPWDTKGIEGTSRFLKKLWRLFFAKDQWAVSDEEPSKEEYKALHKLIKRSYEDLSRYSFNTMVAGFMICANDLADLKCNKRKILEPFLILVSPFAPHITEELWSRLGHTESITFASLPQLDESYLVEDSFAYPVQFNGKVRFNLELSLTLTPQEVEKEVMAAEQTQKYLEGKTPKKVIVVPKRIVNVVV